MSLSLLSIEVNFVIFVQRGLASINLFDDMKQKTKENQSRIQDGLARHDWCIVHHTLFGSVVWVS